MAEVNNTKLISEFVSKYNGYKDNIARIVENSRLLLTDISNVIDRVERGDIKPDSEEINQINVIQNEIPNFKKNVDYLKNRLDEIVNKSEELGLRLRVKREKRGRKYCTCISFTLFVIVRNSVPCNL